MHSSKQSQAIEQRTLRSLDRLDGNLAAILARCSAIKRPTTVAGAMIEFKRIWPVFDEALSFIAVIETNVPSLEEARQPKVRQQLTTLRRTLSRLHLSTVDPLLRMVADGRDPLALGTRHVMERWIKYLDEMDGLLAADPSTQEGIAEREMIEHIRSLAHIILERAPDLQEFTTASAPQLPPPEAAHAPGPRRSASRESAPGAAPTLVRLAVKIQGLRVYIEPSMSVALASEIRRLGLTAGLAAAMGVPPSNVVMVMNGKDPFSTEHLQATTDFLRKNLGENRFELLEGAGA